jgi:ABC-type nitrate/sulfonate/bicarbonate transport system ATPase subunit
MSSTLGFRARIYAIAIKQEVHYVMDEPFAPLDAIVRTRITQERLNWV